MAFAADNFGPGVEVEASNGWEGMTPGREITRKVFCTPDQDGDGADAASFVVNFTVVCESIESARISEVYALDAANGTHVGNAVHVSEPVSPAKVSAWDQSRAQTILAEAKTRYGAGWDHLSDDQRNNFLDAQVLRCLMAQDVEKFTAAQEMVDRMRRAIAGASQATARDKRRVPSA
ncbi:hypothetical protein [Paucibacter soli]|uniref:hypothetical protein n=1 Tax=Paucibacter soli TaxID=3133433 RepID=UPI0030A0F8FE